MTVAAVEDDEPERDDNSSGNPSGHLFSSSAGHPLSGLFEPERGFPVFGCLDDLGEPYRFQDPLCELN